MFKCNYKLWLLSLLGLFLFRLIWIGDATFINDEAELLNRALDANENGDLFTLGLQGTKGAKYGPVPIYFYRFLLSFSHNIFAISIIKLFLVTAMTTWSVTSIWKTMGIKSILPVIFVFASPYLWFYSRNLWDNSLNIPLIAFTFAHGIRYLKEQKLCSFTIAIFGMNLAVQIHLMAIPAILGLGITLVVINWKHLLDHLKTVSLVIIINGLLFFPYAKYLLSAKGAGSPSPILSLKQPLMFPFLGGRILSIYKFDYFLGKEFESYYFSWARFCAYLEYLVVPLVWIGLFVALRSYYLKYKVGETVDIRNKEVLLPSLITFVMFQVMCLYKGIYYHPHYYNGLWVIYLVFVFAAVDVLWNFDWFRPMFVGLVGISWGTLSMIVINLHDGQGTKSLHHGPTLATRVEVAKRIKNLNPGTKVRFDPVLKPMFPLTIALLLKLGPAKSYSGDRQIRENNLVITYRVKNDRFNGAIEFKKE